MGSHASLSLLVTVSDVLQKVVSVGRKHASMELLTMQENMYTHSSSYNYEFCAHVHKSVTRLSLPDKRGSQRDSQKRRGKKS